MDEIDRLEAEVEAKQAAVREHRRHGIAVWFEFGDAIGTADTPVHREWFERYDQLKAEGDKAEGSLLAYLKRKGRD